MTLKIITPPAAEPVSLAEAKTYLRVDHDAEDALIGAFVTAARQRVEALTGRVLISTRQVEVRDGWAMSSQHALPAGPVSEIHEIRLLTADGAAEAVAPADWYADLKSDPARLVSLKGIWPRVRREAGGVEIEFTAGYGDAAEDVPAPLRQAVRALTAEAYEGRGAEAMPLSVQALIAPYARARL